MPTDLPDSLENHTTGRYWGISPESILLYNNATVTGADTAWDALRRYYDLTVYVTNHAVDWKTYTEALETIVDKWFNSQTRLLAQHATPATAQQFVLGAAYETEGGVMRLLRTAQEYAEEEGNGAVSLARRDVQSIADDQSIKLLRSLGALRATVNSYEINREVVRALYGSRRLSTAEACWAILSRICEAHGLSDHDAVVPHLLEAFNVDAPDSSPTTVQGSLPVYAGDDRVAELVDELFSDDAVTVLAEIERK